MQLFSRGDQARSSHRLRRRLSPGTATLLIISVVVVASAISLRVNGAPTARAASWTQVWGDDFNGAAGTAPSSTNWLYDTGTSYPGGAANWGTGEVETNTTSTNNVYLDGSGHLAIKPILSNGTWTSGRIETQQTNFAAPAGGELAVEASLQMPNVTGNAAAGYWPAFWMLGAAFRGVYTNWPSVGEVDAMENVNGINNEWGTLHCGVDPGGPCNETNGLGGQKSCSPSTCQAAFHTYRVEIDRTTQPEEIRWYLDGVQFWQVYSNNPGMDATTWANAVDHGFFIILNVAMGGAFPAAFGGGPTASTQSGVPLLVDYVHVFTSAGAPTATPAATATPSSCPSGSFAQGAANTGASTAQVWFEPCGWTAGYVILHYTVPGQVQQNVQMTYDSGTARWEYTVNGISAGQTLSYSFTYQQNGLQYDTGSYSWTDSSGGGPTPTPASTPTPTPVPCPSGSYLQGVDNSGSTSALPWFEPCGWTAGYVIVHYTLPGQVQQNVQMAYNSGKARWEYSVGGMSAGQTLSYSFTYQQNGLQYDTGSYSWTHP
ncbi:MAG TPA: glycoside hydrolase family 16 protein [Ktedonobacterales bacterium]|nr:glycoside hydrolase family 16 protein [Ktedonobacterales bacterium]